MVNIFGFEPKCWNGRQGELKFFWDNISCVFESLLGYRGHSLIGKTTELQSVNLGSRPDISKAREAQLVERNIEAV